jgi:2-methylfumaryl-CoA hydratase
VTLSPSSAKPPPRAVDGYFFEDYRVGQVFRHATPRTITEGDISLYMALTGARQPLHCAHTVAKAMGYPTSPVDDLLVFHIAFGKTVPDISFNAVANLGYADCRFLRPVFVGDTLRCETEIVGLKPNSSGKTGVVYVRSNAFNQRNENVLTWVRWVMVHRRTPAPGGTTNPQGQTTFAEAVPPEAIVAPALTEPAHAMRDATGSDVMWDDIDGTGKCLLRSHAGMTVEEADHMLATRLYQNTARVHFDQQHMQNSTLGKRLVYGGHVISICRALMYDGLENVIGIAAINGGSHSNPVFAGDTITATAHPLAKWPVNAHLGAVQLRINGYKNVTPSTNVLGGDNQVLSLDLTVLMPRRI